jgi:hypothetical protein
MTMGYAEFRARHRAKADEAKARLDALNAEGRARKAAGRARKAAASEHTTPAPAGAQDGAGHAQVAYERQTLRLNMGVRRHRNRLHRMLADGWEIESQGTEWVVQVYTLRRAKPLG